jgi:hypothetical protein
VLSGHIFAAMLAADMGRAPSIETNTPAQPSRWKECRLIWLLCGVAALRVFVYSAAFPFFNNVDEVSHFDMVIKYSRLPMPTGMAHYSEESIPSIVESGSPEYLYSLNQFPNGRVPPPHWLHPDEPVRVPYGESLSWWRTHPNHESANAPLYYIVAGLWMRVGQWVGLKDLCLLYWIRFLNIAAAGGLIWTGYAAARIVFPERRHCRLGVPLLLAFFPQSIYYAIQSDTLSPLCYGAAFVGLINLLGTDTPGRRLGILTGLALASVWLVKVTNLPLVGVGMLAVVFKAISLGRAGKLRQAMAPLALLLGCAAAPIGAWCLWCQYAFGDFTGATVKIHSLFWIPKPFADWWRHPVFTPAGLVTFWSGLVSSFWRGELVWMGRRLAVPGVDAFYWGSSLLLAGAAVFSLLWEGGGAAATTRKALWLSFWSFAGMVAFMGLTSIAFDYRNCDYPSASHPYVTSGRLLCGALIPFLLLYVHGLDKALSPIKSGAASAVALAGIVVLMVVSEFLLNLPAFSSQYNWFHHCL